MWDQRKYEDNLAISRASNSEIAEATRRLMAERDEWKQRAEAAEARVRELERHLFTIANGVTLTMDSDVSQYPRVQTER